MIVAIPESRTRTTATRPAPGQNRSLILSGDRAALHQNVRECSYLTGFFRC